MFAFKHLKSAGLWAGLVLSSLVSPAFAATFGANAGRDPSRMLASEGKVYIYITDGGAKSSPDGLIWTDVAMPPWNKSLVGNQGLWTPDGIYVNGKYLLYGSMATASKATRIVLLSSPTLNPASAKYAWKDEGTVIDGPAGVKYGVIDPAPVLDADGKLYLVWGGGVPFTADANSIFLTRLDNNTGLPLTSDPGWLPPDQPGYPLKQGRKEGPYLHRHAGRYFLFYQTGSCCSGAASTYTIKVAMATTLTGPYTDDRTFYASKDSIHGPGHIGIYEQCGSERFTYHYNTDTGEGVIGENELTWGDDAWPAVGPEATTALTICDPTSGTGGGGGATGSGGRSGTAGGSSTAGSSGVAGSSPTAGATGSGNGGRTSGGRSGSMGGAVGSGGSSPDTDTMDPSGPAPEGGTSGTSEPTPGTNTDSPDPTRKSTASIGCVCSLPGTGHDGTAWSFAGAAGLVLAALRRRRS